MKGLKIFGGILLGVALIVFVGIASKACDVASGVVNRVVDPVNIIYNYEWYISAYNDIEAQRGIVKIAKEKYDKAGSETRPQAEIEYYGARQTLTNRITEYNAHAMMETRNYWKDSRLPEKIAVE